MAALSYYRPILRLGVPIAIGQLGVIIMGFADTMMVGHYGTQSLAAASFVNAIFNFIICMLLGYSYGITPIISTLKGQNKLSEAGGALKHGLLCNVLFVLLVMLCLSVAYFYLDRMGQPAELLPLIKPYYVTILISTLFVAVFNALRQFTDGLSETSTGMWVILSGNVLNIVGNYLLIYGPGPFPRLGLLGAGLSTLSTRVVMAMVMLVFFLSRRHYGVYRQGFRQLGTRLSAMLKINRLSLPIALQMGMECGAFAAAGIMAGWLGATELAAFQIMISISGLGYLFYYSFGSGITIRVAHFCGARDWAGVHHSTRAGRHILLVLVVMVSAILLFGGGLLIRTFSTDLTVVAMALTLIMPMIVYQLGDSMQICYANALRGTSHVSSVMWIAFVSYVVVNLPVGYVLAFVYGYGIQGLFYSFSSGLFVAAVLYWWQYRRVVRRLESC